MASSTVGGLIIFLVIVLVLFLSRQRTLSQTMCTMGTPAIPTASEAGGKSVTMSGTSYRLMLAGLSMSLFVSPITVRIVGILRYVFLLIRIRVGESLPEIDEVRVRAQQAIDVLSGTCKFVSAPPNTAVPTQPSSSGALQ